MNPLSALRTLAYPALRAEPTVPTTAASATPNIIPFTELEKLSPGLLPNPIGAPQAAPGGFDTLVTGLINEVSAKQAAAGEAVTGLLSGQNVSLHQTMIAMEEASISFQLMVEVRNKLLESYQELMRMQI
jgi:flagellar hook-basal body complex protein FliE